jgi:UDPglucose 6-dehydrogenase
LTFELSLGDCQPKVDVGMVALAVPADTRPDGSVDLSVLVTVLKTVVAWQPARDAIVCVRSTLSVGDSAQMLAAIGDSDLPNRYVYWPAFLRQHRAFVDLARPDRIVLGSGTTQVANRFVNRILPADLHNRVLTMSFEAAEAVKQMSNSVLAVNQVLAAELASICEKYTIEPEAVFQGIAADFRIGQEILEHRPGLCDLCLSKDLSAMCRVAGVNGKLLSSAARRSDELRRLAVQNVVGHVCRIGPQPNVAIVGLGYAPGVGDTRGALSPQLLTALQGRAKVRVWDGYADVSAVIGATPGVEAFPSLELCLESADVAVLLVDHPELQQVDWKTQAESMRGARPIFDFAHALCASQRGASEFCHPWYTPGVCTFCSFEVPPREPDTS